MVRVMLPLKRYYHHGTYQFAGAITLGDTVAIDTTNSGGSGTGGDVSLSTLDGGSFTVDAGSEDLVVGAVGVSALNCTVSNQQMLHFSMP